MSQKTWGGRFSGSTDERVEQFTESISIDRRLYRHDIIASQAHAKMLAEVGLITAAEAGQIVAALDAIGTDIEAGRMEYKVSLEDIHTHIEQALIAKLGDVGRKLHTGRSRNDQVITDVKLWVRDAIDELDHRLVELLKAFVGSAERERDVILPGYTHLQQRPTGCLHRIISSLTRRSSSGIVNASPMPASVATSFRWGSQHSLGVRFPLTAKACD